MGKTFCGIFILNYDDGILLREMSIFLSYIYLSCIFVSVLKFIICRNQEINDSLCSMSRNEFPSWRVYCRRLMQQRSWASRAWSSRRTWCCWPCRTSWPWWPTCTLWGATSPAPRYRWAIHEKSGCVDCMLCWLSVHKCRCKFILVI